MLTLLSVAYWTFFIVTLPIGFAIALVIWVATFPFDRNANVIHRYACLWGHFYILCCPIWTVKITGREKIPPGAMVLVSNHESLIDILVLFSIHGPFKWVSKRSNFKLPIIGWFMHMCRYIPVVRGDRASVERMMLTSREWLGRGISVLIFPEGTRSKTGAMQAFKDGAFFLALETGAPIVPIAIQGTARTLPKHGLALQDRMDAIVEVLDPIDPAAFSSVPELREHTRTRIADALQRKAVVA